MTRPIIHEVGMRDGLQMEKETVPTAQKLQWISRLAASGVDMIQVGAFVHPGKVPQMADTDQLFQELLSAGPQGHAPVLSALMLNEKGLDRGLACGVEMFCMGVSASETHSMKNTGMSTADAIETILGMARRASEAGKKVQVSVQSAFGCGFEGPVPQERVLGIVRQFVDSGLSTISLADTAGHAVPDQVERMYAAVFALEPGLECACHFHNTYGLGIANTYAALKAGAKYAETSVAGLGGCPFTKIAGGNACTEDLVHMLQRMGICREINLDLLIETAQDISRFFHRTMPGMVHVTGKIPAAAGAGA